MSGPDLWPVVRAQLDAVTRLIPGTTGATADRLMLLAAEHAHWLSWVAWQEEKRGPALAWIDLAHGWAVDGGHPDMASWAQRVRAHYSLEHGDPIRALRTAEGARFAGPRPLSPAAEAAAVHQEAMAAAQLGERDRAVRLAEQAHGLALRAPDEGERPGWLYWLDATRARLQAADAAYACQRWADAAAGFREGLSALAGFPRDHAYYRARLEDAERRA
ncbi:XRE family transcriptional regulator [Streptomyces graminofaciens]|uniref:XRE family transcriptional regulator n=1 Tax=Streptomyces graminofaciens TaxID=68212 RepID=UPI0025747400|nr:XRE family transcriptional regulator [Streptomyces graminofaciens]